MPFKKGHKGHPRKNRVSLAATSTPAPVVKDDASDEEMRDRNDDDDDDDNDNGDQTILDNGDDEEDAATPAQDDNDDDDDDDDEDGTPRITTIPRRRGTGRRPGRPSTRHLATPEPGDDASDSGTPYRRRGRGRPVGSGRGGGTRGGRRTRIAEAPHVMVDGEKVDVVNDDAQLDFDDEGEEKVDENGNLKGDREYRVRTFKIIGREDRLYMLSTEPARCCGFRDSYLFFNKHPKLFKVLLGDAEKKDLIDRDILPNSYKGRNIGVVTARSVFREFGAKIIVGGKRVTDDYRVAEARANGEVEGELADPDDRVTGTEDYNRNRYVAWHGASDVYRGTGGAVGPAPGKPAPAGSKRKGNCTIENWQTLHAREAIKFNQTALAMRRSTLDGVYDTHTNTMFIPKIMQPTHARWEQIPPPPLISEEDSDTKHLTNGTSHHETTELNSLPPHDNTTTATTTSPKKTLFAPVPRTISHNFIITDTLYTSPPLSGSGYPGPDNLIIDPTSGASGLSGIPSDLLDELPEDCRRAFEEAKKLEVGWKQQWGTEGESGMRGRLRVGFSGYPV